LSEVQLGRASLLFGHGAVPKTAVEAAENAAANALVDIETAREHLRILGSDPDHPTAEDVWSAAHKKFTEIRIAFL
jgi:hypothetical protein